MLKEVKNKLKLLNQTNRQNAANIVAAEIAEGSEYDSHGEGTAGTGLVASSHVQPQLQHQMLASKKKKKGTSVKKQKFN